MLIIDAPAKINLLLDVKSKRKDGYHELETVMHQINLFDRIYLQQEESGTGIQLNCSDNNLPAGKENLAFYAAETILKRADVTRGVKIYIEKNIPVGAGLAGGSTDAAAVLKGLNLLFEFNFSQNELEEMAAGIGSDVPFCLWGNRIISIENEPGLSDNIKRKQYTICDNGASALARGRGEILTPLKNVYIPWILLVKPDLQLSTAQVYGGLDLKQRKTTADVESFLTAWTACDIINIARTGKNVLESVSITICPEIARIKNDLETAGAIKATMSGSGPTVFGIFASEEAALKAKDVFERRYREVYLVSSFARSD